MAGPEPAAPLRLHGADSEFRCSELRHSLAHSKRTPPGEAMMDTGETQELQCTCDKMKCNCMKKCECSVPAV